MSISELYIGRVAKNMIDFLEERKVQNVRGLDNLVDKKIPVKAGEFIITEMRPSLRDELAYTVSYYAPVGVPLEIKINERSGYSKIIVKSGLYFEGYRPFYQDPLGNFAQMKELNHIDIPKIKQELEKLATQS